MNIDLEKLIKPCIELAKEAGVAILNVYNSNSKIDVQIKSDSTPLTQADLIAHDIITKKLSKLTPQLAILSEEDSKIPYSTRQQWETYWLIDPLDGTKEFIHRTDEFTVNIALIHQGHSVFGVIYAPVLELCYYAYAHGGAFKLGRDKQSVQIHTSKVDINNLRIILSRRHYLEKAVTFIEKIPSHTKVLKGSSLKTCFIAEGLADAYPCFGKTSEWDMGAAQCIIEEAGGAMIDLEFQPIKFNHKESLLNPPLLVVGDKDYNWQQYIE